MIAYEIYVPLCDNRGQDIHPSHLDSLKARLSGQFGGFTHFPQEAEGEWTMGGITFRDRIIILRVLADTGAETRAWFAALKEELLAEYRQSDFLITFTATGTV